jgi:hypothetical protein
VPEEPGEAEGDMNPAYISAFAALTGAIIGGLTSFATTWFTQRTQLRNAHREAKRAKLEALYNALGCRGLADCRCRISRVAAGAFGFSRIELGHNQQMVGGVYQD